VVSFIFTKEILGIQRAAEANKHAELPLLSFIRSFVRCFVYRVSFSVYFSSAAF
jgi:hypothetical protein